ncbi:MAG: tRNA pseudouridine(38-40) synthase TruA [Casimicrobiaceae bacterium]|nr:tRNA pseudouridine(38-40) synthase TruA [Casimicrobiaceae bacterium]MCX8098057.1 tRNA pseudouridine(38-40) synthase TruA [Casimicrobiaceae bacterium]MDW8313097.1 tRNA pseudouridine(38-40) synthase TruA [Burkholderiales bacterium]
MRWALGLDYAGTSYAGWQRQAGADTVQARIEQALSAVAQAPVTVVAAGRTDAGVHASLQIVHFDAPVPRPASAWARGTQRYLPRAIGVRWAQPVPPAFHARYSARSRRYTYLLLSSPSRPGLWSGRVGWTHWPLDLERIEAALPAILGRHDFSSFRAAECQAKSPVKTLYAASVRRQGALLRFEFHADAFLQHMVRNLIGALLYIGSRRKPVDWLSELLAVRDRTLAAPTFAPDGLYLSGIEYDSSFALPEAYVDPLPALEAA